MVERTRRQELRQRLRQGDCSFDDLRRELQVSVRLLEDDLRHLDRTLRSGQERLVVTPASCLRCGFVFRGRAPRHLHTPGRCPRCRGEHMEPPRFRVERRTA